MTVLAISTVAAVLASIGLLLGLVIALVVVKLFNGIMGPAREIDDYAGKILTAGIGIAKNVDGVDELQRTRELAAKLPGLAGAYLTRLRGGRA